MHIEFIQKPSMLSFQESRNEQGYQLKLMAVIKVIKVIVIAVITMIKVINQGECVGEWVCKSVGLWVREWKPDV